MIWGGGVLLSKENYLASWNLNYGLIDAIRIMQVSHEEKLLWKIVSHNMVEAPLHWQ